MGRVIKLPTGISVIVIEEATASGLKQSIPSLGGYSGHENSNDRFANIYFNGD